MSTARIFPIACGAALFAAALSAPALACETCATSVSLNAEEAICVREQLPDLIERRADPALLFRDCADGSADAGGDRSLIACIPGASCDVGAAPREPSENARASAMAPGPLILRHADLVCLDARLNAAELGGEGVITVTFAADCAAP